MLELLLLSCTCSIVNALEAILIKSALHWTHRLGHIWGTAVLFTCDNRPTRWPLAIPLLLILSNA